MNILRNCVFVTKNLKAPRNHSGFLSKFRFSTNYNSQGLLRIHGRLRYDENMHIKNDEFVQDVRRR